VFGGNDVNTAEGGRLAEEGRDVPEGVTFEK